MRHESAIIAAKIVAHADRAHPADELLRRELKGSGSIAPDQAREISRGVFSYFRWKRWLANAATPNQVVEAVSLAKQFAAEPGAFDDADLVRRVAPDWAAEELEITPAWARSLQSEPKLWLRARPGSGRALMRRLNEGCAVATEVPKQAAELPITRSCWAARVFGDGALADIIEYSGHEDLFRTAAFHAGEFEIQDISSQAVGLGCAPQAGETWWDACAGEGGKLLHLSDLMGNKGLIWASDRAAWRLVRLRRRAARARVFNYRVALWGGGEKLPTRTAFDGVLVDAPCSGVGTWQRNPHARWTTTREDVLELAQVQKRMLLHAARAVKRGGKLVYAVCTVTRSETSEVVKALEASCSELEPLAISNPLRPGSAAERGLFIRSEQCGGNGMFIAAWRRSLSDHKHTGIAAECTA